MADNFLFKNNASALLAGSISDVDLSLSVETGYGALFPNPTGAQKFRMALQDANGNLEIVNVTARVTDTMTIERGQEGTTAQSWTLGVTRCELRLTQETMEELLQKNGGTMTGTLDMNTNTLNDAVIDGVNTVIQGGQIVGVPLRGVVDDSSNEIAVPSDGTRATAGGSPVLTQADLASNGGLNLLPINTIVMWYGTPASLPAGWQLCDGTGGTPSLTDRVPIGAGNLYSLGDGGGATTASGTTSADGGHTPTGSVQSHTLVESELPTHHHTLLGDTSAATTSTHGLGSAVGRSVAGRSASVTLSQIENSGVGSNQLVGDTGGGGGHTHGLSMDAVADHTHTLSSISILPPYRAVYFIMKVS